MKLAHWSAAEFETSEIAVRLLVAALLALLVYATIAAMKPCQDCPDGTSRPETS